MADHLETYGCAKLKVLLWTMKKERKLRKILCLKTSMTFGRHFTIQIRAFFTGMDRKFGF